MEDQLMSLHHARAGEVVDLRPLGPALKSAKTSAIVKSERFEAIRMIVRAGETIPSHKVAGNITLHCLEGRVPVSGCSSTAAKCTPWKAWKTLRCC
jgi:quercetin dioxygenase-like cupin family protein